MSYPTIGDPSRRLAAPLPSTTRFGRPEGYDERIWQARVDLAAAYHLCHKFDFNEGVCNHLTVMVPGTTDRFLCIPYGLMWDEVTASNLLLLDETGTILEGEGSIDATAFFIHRAIHAAGAVAVLHTHQPYASAICCTKEFKLHMCHQNCLRFYDEIAYDPEFNGLVLDEGEGERLAKLMGRKRVLLHQNHAASSCAARPSPRRSTTSITSSARVRCRSWRNPRGRNSASSRTRPRSDSRRTAPRTAGWRDGRIYTSPRSSEGSRAVRATSSARERNARERDRDRRRE